MIRKIRESSPSYEANYFELETKNVPRETLWKLRDGAYKNTQYKQKTKTIQTKKKHHTKKKIRLCNQTQKTRQTILHV